MTEEMEPKNPLAKENPKPIAQLREPKTLDKGADVDWEDPEDIKKYVDRFVYSQDDAKVALAVAFSDFIAFDKTSHTLLIGPSGCGKTYLLSTLCDAAGVPFVKISLANVSAEGYKGNNLSESLEGALKGVRKGIIFLDEFDKRAVSKHNAWREGFGELLQKELLAYYTGEMIHGVDTSNFLIVAAGAFHGGFGQHSIYSIIQRRLGGSQAKVSDFDLLKNLIDQDLVEYGYMPELIGRIPNKAGLIPLDADGLYHILTKTENAPAQVAAVDFAKMGIELSFEERALREIARSAVEGIGARGLQSVVNQLIQPYSFHRRKYKGTEIVITEAQAKEQLTKEVKFEQPDNIEVDWKNPQSIVDYLNNYVVGQDEAKQELAKAFHFYHLRQLTGNGKIPKANILVIGPSGSGKTYMVDLLAKKAELPIAKVNLASGYSLEKAFEQFSDTQSTGIVYADEVDNVLLNPADPVNSDLENCLENGTVGGRNTSGFLYILSGAFQKLYDWKKQIIETQTGKEIDGYEGIEITMEDLRAVGIPREILGRVPIVANLKPLTQPELVEIMQKDESILSNYGTYFGEMGKRLEVEEGVLDVMAKYSDKKQGARGLIDVANKLFGAYVMGIATHEGDVVRVTTKDAEKILC